MLVLRCTGTRWQSRQPRCGAQTAARGAATLTLPWLRRDARRWRSRIRPTGGVTRRAHQATLGLASWLVWSSWSPTPHWRAVCLARRGAVRRGGHRHRFWTRAPIVPSPSTVFGTKTSSGCNYRVLGRFWSMIAGIIAAVLMTRAPPPPWRPRPTRSPSARPWRRARDRRGRRAPTRGRPGGRPRRSTPPARPTRWRAAGRRPARAPRRRGRARPPHPAAAERRRAAARPASGGRPPCAARAAVAPCRARDKRTWSRRGAGGARRRHRMSGGRPVTRAPPSVATDRVWFGAAPSADAPTAGSP